MNQAAGFEPALDSQATGHTSVEALPFHRQAISKYAYIGPTPSICTLLVIDTEGHDYRILRQFDLARIRPLLVIFEHQHLSAEEKAEACALLRRHQYRWFDTPEGDTFAWRRA